MIFTAALAVRFIFLNGFQNSPLFDVEVKGVDPSLYHEWAKELAEGFWPGYRLLYGHPFYPYIVSFFYRFWAVDSYSFIVVQFFLGSISCLLIYFITKKIFSSHLAAALSSLIAAFYGPFLFYEGLLMPNALAIFLNLTGLFMLLSILDYPSPRRTFLAGLLLGCSLITNSGVAPFIFLSLCWIIFTLKKSKKTAAIHAGFFMLAVILPLLLISFKHFAAEGRFDSFAAHGGINFYVGNNSEANGAFRAPLGFTPNAEGLSRDSAEYAKRACGSDLSAAAISRFWYSQAFYYISSHPFRWTGLLFKKMVLFWNNVELGDVADYYFAKRASFLLKFNPLSFGFIAALGFLGMLLARKKIPGGFLLYAGIVSFMFSCALFFVNSRYRLSVVPYLVPFAGFALSCAWDTIRLGKFKRLALFFTAFMAFYIFSNANIISADNRTPMYNLAVIYEKKGDYDKAIAISEKLLEKEYNLPMVHFNLGVCYYQKKMKDAAEAEFKETLRLSPDDKDSHFNLGVVYYEKKAYKEAMDEFKASLRSNEKDVAPYYWIGKIYKQQRNFDKALEAYQNALKINPDVIEVKNALAEVKDLQKSRK